MTQNDRDTHSFIGADTDHVKVVISLGHIV